MNTREATVFVVDDEKSGRDSVVAVVSTMGIPAEAFGSAEEFLEAYNPEWPGCLVTDVRMPQMSGVELQERLLSDHVKIPVVVITAYAEVSLAVRAMKNGAITVLEKPCGKQEMEAAIRDALETDARNRETSARRAEYESRLATLSIQEQQVLEAIVAGKLNKVIATELDVSLRTIEARRHNVFEKMKTNSVADLVRLVVEAEMTNGRCCSKRDESPVSQA